jgi:hypothetical protein
MDVPDSNRTNEDSVSQGEDTIVFAAPVVIDQVSTSAPFPDICEPAYAESTIVENVAAFIRRFIFLRESALYDLAAVWVIGTYLTDVFDYVGYLFAYSPEPQSGKSRFLEVLGCLVKNSSGLMISPTEATLFRLASTTTLLIDEVDSCSHSDSLKGVLNAGFHRNSVIWRTREVNGGRELENHSAFGPKALAGIGMRILSAPTRDRTFMFEMVRQTMDERRERFSLRRIRAHADWLKKEILKWSEANKIRVQELYDQAESAIPYLNDFGDRTIDIALPLAAIVEVVYTGNPMLEMARSNLKRAISLTRNEQQTNTKSFGSSWRSLDMRRKTRSSATPPS